MYDQITRIYLYLIYNIYDFSFSNSLLSLHKIHQLFLSSNPITGMYRLVTGFFIGNKVNHFSSFYPNLPSPFATYKKKIHFISLLYLHIDTTEKRILKCTYSRCTHFHLNFSIVFSYEVSCKQNLHSSI